MLAEIREAVANALSVLPDVQALPYVISNPTPPVVWVFPGQPGGGAAVLYDRSYGRGVDEWTFTVQALVGAAADKGAQVLLDQMLEPSGSSSVKDALENDKTLGGVVFDLHVTESNGLQTFTLAGAAAPFIGSEWTVIVRAVGT